MAKDTTGRLHVTVKTGGKRKLSSKLWLERQLNDPYVAQAKRDGLRSRAAYKLIEIDDKYHFLKSGITVVDLGAAPGGWSQIAAKRVGAADGRGKVIAIDLLEMPEIVGVSFAQLDFLADGAPVLFDPAVYRGDREADLAMTELFGGFPQDFYSAYAEVAPRAQGYAVRKTLYNLYHVLNHANLFGGGYTAQAERMVERLLAELR